MRIGAFLLILLFPILFAEQSRADPSLNDCREIGRICVDTAPRTISGFKVERACWNWRASFDCARPQPIDDGCTALKANLDCTQVSQACIETDEGVCIRARAEWLCSKKPAQIGRAQLISENYRVLSDKLDEGCDRLDGRSDCQQTEHICLSGAETRNIKGLEVTRECWEWEKTYHCLSTGFNNDCAQLEDRDECQLTKTDCIETGIGGLCAHEERTYQCAGVTASVNQSCGSQNWCTGGNCVEQPPQAANQSFGRAAAYMNLLQEIGNDFTATGVDSVSIFSGQRRTCNKWVLALKNCCSDSGLLVSNNLQNCSEDEKRLAVQQESGQAHYISTRCSQKAFFGVCLRRERSYCTFNSRLARILQEHARHQLGISWSNCRGLSTDELESINWEEVDLSEVLGDIEARLSVQEKTELTAEMKEKIKTFYEHNKPTIAAPAPEPESYPDGAPENPDEDDDEPDDSDAATDQEEEGQ